MPGNSSQLRKFKETKSRSDPDNMELPGQSTHSSLRRSRKPKIPPVNVIGIVVFCPDETLIELISVVLSRSGRFSVCGTFVNAYRLVQHMQLIQPQVVLVDAKIRDICPVQAVTLIRSYFPQTKILLLGDSGEEELILDGLCAGAMGHLSRNHMGTSLQRAILKLHGGEPLVSSHILKKMISLVQKIIMPKSASGYNLTPREKEVMSLMVEGCSYKMISARLGIRYDTVHNHIRSIYCKLQVNSMTEAVSKVLLSQRS